MAPRRSRPPESDDEELRPNTPSSAAPHDRKRIRRRVNTVEDENESPAEQVSAPRNSRKPQVMRVSDCSSDDDDDPKTGHQPGAIVRVKLTNFVTYTSAEFFPGPNLNMVIGPNGTGKSTLVCAICLGLGWPPSFLGRAKEPAEFVKHGSSEATIEIELQRPLKLNRNIVIKRVIEREGNKSKFFLNGGASSGPAIKLLAGSLNIQIDNLCQFLPQDKVVEFAQMSPIELLTSTQRAVAGSEMIKWHEDLKKLRNHQTDVMTDDRDAREQLTNLENRQAMQHAEVERMRERATVKKRLVGLEKFRPLVHYHKAKENFLVAKQRMADLSEEIKRLRTAAAPVLRSLDAKKDYEVKARAFKAACEKELAASVKDCERKSRVVEERQGAINDLNNEIQAEKKGVPENRAKLQREQMKLQELKRKKAEVPEAFDSRAMNGEIQELRTRLRALDDQKSELESRRTELADRGDRSVRQFQVLKGQLAGLETQVGQQEGKLENLSRDTLKAWKWIQDHRNEFTAHVYGPPIVECSLKDPRMADVVESFLQTSDFKFITVQNKADFALLQRQLFQGLKLHDVSLRECSTDSLEQFRPPLTDEQMERFGLSSWALDHLQGPPTVLAQLCHERALHRCAISSRELSQQQHDEVAKTHIQSYAAGRKTYHFIRRAEYGAAGTSARVQDMRQARMWTEQPVDMGRKAALQRQMSEVKDEHAMFKSESKNIDKELGQVEENRMLVQKEIEAKQEEKAAKQQALSEWNALDPKIQSHEDKIRTLSQALGGVRTRLNELNDRYDAALLDKTEAVLDLIPATRDVKSKTARMLEAEIFYLEAKSDFEVLKAHNDHILRSIGEREAERNTANEIFTEERDRAKNLRTVALQLRAESEKIAEEGDSSLVDLMDHIVQTVKTEENLEAEIDAEKAKLELTEGGNAGIIAEFEERAKTIERLRNKVRAATQRREEFRHAIGEIRGKWEPRLEDIVAKINDAFSDSFARIGCAGQVAVHKASSDNPADCTEEDGGTENGLDFANWAIHISVKFREQEPLSLLDSHRQSGGERAVSTIFYLMALQSLSRAPFRVVDEINQGMDPRNERMVHGRMVDIAADDGGSQYFLITPKLLSGLKYRRGMTVLCIVSGENMPAARERDEAGNWHDGPKVDFRLFVKRAKQMDMGRFAEGRMIDSGVGINGSFDSTGQSTVVGA
ncbi:uncharacterized protein Z520_05566 [Fonsecaea multimorphosa CBS 102226]|uniref:Structural maintenance of chromosomes protein 5 n=1 Tax=Fonsecaea multimorphosa CBS 102226 TaxID=1442371 RepID=A0A0D2HB29_9EURO|nr:uncharacterized protein Z520_05566 [Fonsecaea multimorphosa CBS 102226]KIX99105.1 hypothetical protein Z520_05566 [Fonsecaea multimorphosa CBS 102226]OAL25367.1 hypothetical protein AYO22_05244 [Fonsecaea multimorphosa]